MTAAAKSLQILDLLGKFLETKILQFLREEKHKDRRQQPESTNHHRMGVASNCQPEQAA